MRRRLALVILPLVFAVGPLATPARAAELTPSTVTASPVCVWNPWVPALNFCIA